MPLTPQDVRNKRFTPVRLREGYDMAEVDAFLDEVETELERLTGERDEPSNGRATSPEATAATELPAGLTPTTDTRAAAAAPAVVPAVVPEVSPAGRAARLLEIAARNADELVAEAQAEAETLLSQAKAQAQQVSDGARAKADELGTETERRRKELLGALERQRTGLGEEIDRLRTFEREYRTRLREYLTSHLATLDGEETDPVALPPAAAERNGRAPA